MKHRIIRIAVGLVFLASAGASAATTFVDLTAKEYKGPDSDLAGLSLSKFGVNCEEGGAYVPRQPAYVSWENQSGKNQNGSNYLVKAYKINFRIKDRRGQVIHQESFDYSDKVRYGKDHYVLHDSYETKCDRDAVKFTKSVDLSFSTVEFWVSKVEWTKFEQSQPEADKVAFSVESQVAEADKQSRERRNSGKDLVVAYIRPTAPVGKFELEPGTSAYVLNKGTFRQQLRTVASWNSAIKEACVKTGCPDWVIEKTEKGENIGDGSIFERCQRFGCLALISEPQSKNKDQVQLVQRQRKP